MDSSSSNSSTCESASPSPVSVDHRVVDRSLEWMRRQQRLSCNAAASWTARHSLRTWNPWTNQTRPQAATVPAKRPHQSANSSPSSSEPATSVTKAAGSLYDMLLSQELQQQERDRQRQQLGAGSVISDSMSSSVPRVRPRSNSNTNNKNPFGAGGAGSGLRDVQRHQGADGKRTTIITQFKTAETNQDGKVDINIIMDSESNVSNAPDSSDEATTEADDSSKEAGAPAASAEDGAGGGSTTDNDSTTGAGGGAPSASTDEDGGEGGQGGQEPETPSTSPGEDDEADEGEGEGDGEGGEEPADDLPAPGDEKKDSKTDKKKVSISHLDKEGIVIGCMNVFADVSRKEYIVLLTDRVVEAFLVDPGQFRSIAKRTGCEIEVTRRILNRRIGTYRWVKYLVVTLRGPNLVAIDQCDRLMVKIFPPYKIRKPYPEAAQVALFVKESYPDNSDLYFNFQRTGPTVSRVGDMQLKSPFGKVPNRPIESTQWKQSNPRLLRGILEPRNLPIEISIEHVYPEWGTEKCSFMDTSCKWEQAGDLALETEKKNNLERSLRVKQRKLGAETLFAGGD